MRLIYFIPLSFLFLLMNSCFEEVSDATLLPATPGEEVVVPIDEGNPENFYTNRGRIQIDYAHVYAIPPRAEGESVYQLVLTNTEVQEGDYLTGSSAAISLFLTSPDGILEGTYNTEVPQGERSASGAGFYRQLDFSGVHTAPTDAYRNGSVEITKINDNYVISLAYADPSLTLGMEGTYEGVVAEVVPWPMPIPDETSFQGNNTFTVEGEETSLGYAYLYAKGAGYKLAITESELSSEGDLSGISTSLIFSVWGDGGLASGVFPYAAFTDTDRDFLSGGFKRPGSSPLFCTNYNFETGSADDDDQSTGETLLLFTDDEFMFRFTGTRTSDNKAVDAIYRGPLTIVD